MMKENRNGVWSRKNKRKMKLYKANGNWRKEKYLRNGSRSDGGIKLIGNKKKKLYKTKNEKSLFFVTLP